MSINNVSESRHWKTTGKSKQENNLPHGRGGQPSWTASLEYASMDLSETQVITVTLLKWDKFNKRKDIKHPWWFAMSNTFLEDPEMEDLSNSEAWAWVYLMSLSSKKKSSTITIPWANVRRQTRFKPKDLISALKKLLSYRIVETHVQNPFAIRTESVRDPYGTEQNRTIQDNTRQDTETADASLSPNDLIQIWNNTAKSLPRAEKLTSSRNASATKRLKENPEPSYWISIAQRIESSSFCKGSNDRGWVATFDWFITPDAHVKVSEGKYDDRKVVSRKIERASPKPVNQTSTFVDTKDTRPDDPNERRAILESLTAIKKQAGLA